MIPHYQKIFTWSKVFWLDSASKLSEDFIDPFCRFNSSRILTSRIFAGKSSTSSSTSILHSGHLNSFLVSTISFKHLLQNVCWQGNTLQLWLSCSRHTEHSKSSFNCTVSMSSVEDVKLRWRRPWIRHRQSILQLQGFFKTWNTCMTRYPFTRSDQNICTTSNILFPFKTTWPRQFVVMPKAHVQHMCEISALISII